MQAQYFNVTGSVLFSDRTRVTMSSVLQTQGTVTWRYATKWLKRAACERSGHTEDDVLRVDVTDVVEWTQERYDSTPAMPVEH